MSVLRAATVHLVVLALLVTGCSSTYVKVELPTQGAAQAVGLDIKAGSKVGLFLADGRRLERRFVSADAAGVVVMPRYYADVPQERFAYGEIARVERFESTRVMGNIGKGILIAIVVVLILCSQGCVAPPTGAAPMGAVP